MTEGVADGELVRRIAQQDRARDAEAELCRRFAPRVRLYGLRHLGTLDRATDLVQAVLLAVLEAARAGRIEEPDHVERFVLGTSRNMALRVRRTEARATPTEPSELDVGVFLPTFEHIDAGPLMQCLSKLDGRSRTVIVMSFQSESSADEIAGLLETTAGNIRVVRHRALLQLRRCLDSGKEQVP
ncbi:MAG TPA: sigma-70 family RNA polymerase sigma factor [Polyangiaceae bacterium]